VPERPFSQEGGCLIVAHRGASREAPENTLEAFERAVAAGSDAIEFDVRLTADGVPVVMHDPTVDRTTDGTGLVRAMSIADVGHLRIARRFSVPTLGEALAELSGRAGVDIELKNIPGEPDFDPSSEALVDAVMSELERVGFVGDVILSSFNPLAIARSRAVAPQTPTGLCTDPTVDAEIAVSFARQAGHAWAMPFVDRVLPLADVAVTVAHDAGVRLGAWVVDDPGDAHSLAGAGLDALATNDPASIAEALGR